MSEIEKTAPPIKIAKTKKVFDVNTPANSLVQLSWRMLRAMASNKPSEFDFLYLEIACQIDQIKFSTYVMRSEGIKPLTTPKPIAATGVNSLCIVITKIENHAR